MFLIEDELHAEQIGEFASRNEAIVELRRLARIAWDREPNQAPLHELAHVRAEIPTGGVRHLGGAVEGATAGTSAQCLRQGIGMAAPIESSLLSRCGAMTVMSVRAIIDRV